MRCQNALAPENASGANAGHPVKEGLAIGYLLEIGAAGGEFVHRFPLGSTFLAIRNRVIDAVSVGRVAFGCGARVAFGTTFWGPFAGTAQASVFQSTGVVIAARGIVGDRCDDAAAAFEVAFVPLAGLEAPSQCFALCMSLALDVCVVVEVKGRVVAGICGHRILGKEGVGSGELHLETAGGSDEQAGEQRPEQSWG